MQMLRGKEGSMEVAGLQGRVARFVEESGLAAPVESRALDLVSEVGEVAKETLIGTRYGKQSFEPGERWGEELGDAFFSLICLANCTGVDLDVSLQRALDKYEKRLGQAGDAGSGR